jgi:hypothetical protein
MKRGLSTEIQAGASCVLAAFLGSYLIWRRVSVISIIGFLGFLIAFTTLFRVTVKAIVRATMRDPTTIRAREHMTRVEALPIAEAKEQALKILLDPAQFRISRSTAKVADDVPSGDMIRDFFSRFDSATAIRGETIIARDRLGPSALRPGFTRIGNDAEFTDIVVHDREDRVFCVDGSEASDPGAGQGYRTIYHYILVFYSDGPNSSDTKS